MKPLTKRFFLCLILLTAAPACMALAPNVRGARLPAVEQELPAAGCTVIGRHSPKGIPGNATIVITAPVILDAIGKVGGSAISAAALRVGARADGGVSHMNPEYWHRAFVRGKFGQVEAAVKAAQAGRPDPEVRP